MTQFVEQLRNQAKWYTQPGHNARDLLDSRLLEKAADEIECLSAKIAEMERQEPVGEIVAFGESLHEVSWKRGKLPHLGTKLYALPGAQPAPSISPAGDGRALSDRAKRLVRLIAGTHRGNIETHRELYALIDSMAVAVDSPPSEPAPSVPREAIEKMLKQLMDIAVSNGANSVSMPDEYVEVAAWLCGIPAQPAPSIHEVTDAMALAFHSALTDGSIGEREMEEIKAGLRAALAAAPGSSRDDQHAGGLKALNHQGLMERARQNAKKEVGLIYPDDDARREEKEQELASEYYRQYTTPNP